MMGQEDRLKVRGYLQSRGMSVRWRTRQLGYVNGIFRQNVLGRATTLAGLRAGSASVPSQIQRRLSRLWCPRAIPTKANPRDCAVRPITIAIPSSVPLPL